MLELPQVTLISISTRDVERAVRALEYSCRGINFGAVKLVSHFRPDCASYIQHDRIDSFPDIDSWNRYIVYFLTLHIQTAHALIIHPDGHVVNADSWRDKWLSYDYCGSPWSHECALAIQGGRDQPYTRVGNSVGLRSKKLLDIPQHTNMEWRRYNHDSNEDTYVSSHAWDKFSILGCTKMPFEEAIYFGREEHFQENDHITNPFLFHKYWGKNSQYQHLI